MLAPAPSAFANRPSPSIRRATRSIAASVTVLLLSSVGAAGAAEVYGDWRTPVDNGVIRIERCGESLCGRSLTSNGLKTHPDALDLQNHDPALRNRRLKDLLIMKLRAKGGNAWGDGWIYNPRDGGTYHASLNLEGSDTIKLTGCLAPLLCKTQSWKRVGG